MTGNALEAVARRELIAFEAALGEAVLGQRTAVRALLLALVSGENLLLLGPPGSAKSQLARAAAQSVTPNTLISCHRDMRAAELLGAEELERRAIGEVGAVGSSEVVRTRRGVPQLEGSRCVVLDDLSRAPAELRASVTACMDRQGDTLWIATAGETELYADPLEAGLLDRFTLQVRLRGLLDRGDWRVARQVLALPSRAFVEPLRASGLDVGRSAASRLPLAPGVESRLIEVLQKLRLRLPGAGLSDRFARSSWSLARAAAWLRGSSAVESLDLNALRYALDARLSAESLADLDASGLFDADFEAPPRLSTAEAGEAGLSQSGASRVVVPHRARSSSESLAGLKSVGLPPPAASVGSLARAFGGSRRQGGHDLRDHPGGMPRSYRAWRRGDALEDGDPLDVARYTAGELPQGPRVLRRRRRDAGGSVLLLRDVSASMEGRLGRWASQAVAGIVGLAARRRMRIAYVEFNDQTTAFQVAGRLFHRGYADVLRAASRRTAEGQTTLSAPLSLALDAFERQSASAGRHVVLLTDGLPVLGDPDLRVEQARLRSAKVHVHTLFLGLGPCPQILERLSASSAGLCLRPRPGSDGRLEIVERL